MNPAYNDKHRDPLTDTAALSAARTKAAEASLGTSADPIYRAVLRALEAGGASGRILDFGAGTGILAQALCAMGCYSNVTAVDLLDFSSGVTHSKLAWLFTDLNHELPVEGEVFDAIVSAEVIEHLENPRFVAREWFRLLKPGGILVLSTPNNENWRSILSLVFKEHFFAFTGSNYPAHLTALLRADLSRILVEAGFENIHFSFTDHGSLPRLTHVTWQRLSFGHLAGLRYSDNIVCAAMKPV